MFENADVIFAYTRAQAIEDGELIDVTETAKEAGFKFPVAITRRLYHEVITPDPRSVEDSGQSIQGRLWDALSMLIWAAKGTLPSKRYRYGISQVTEYQCYFIMKRRQKRLLTLKAIIGPGDTPEAVITIMMPDEN